MFLSCLSCLQTQAEEVTELDYRLVASRIEDPVFGQIGIQGSVPRTKGDFNNFIEWIFDMILKVLKIWDVLL